MVASIKWRFKIHLMVLSFRPATQFWLTSLIWIDFYVKYVLGSALACIQIMCILSLFEHLWFTGRSVYLRNLKDGSDGFTNARIKPFVILRFFVVKILALGDACKNAIKSNHTWQEDRKHLWPIRYLLFCEGLCTFCTYVRYFVKLVYWLLKNYYALFEWVRKPNIYI